MSSSSSVVRRRLPVIRGRNAIARSARGPYNLPPLPPVCCAFPPTRSKSPLSSASLLLPWTLGTYGNQPAASNPWQNIFFLTLQWRTPGKPSTMRSSEALFEDIGHCRRWKTAPEGRNYSTADSHLDSVRPDDLNKHGRHGPRPQPTGQDQFITKPLREPFSLIRFYRIRKTRATVKKQFNLNFVFETQPTHLAGGGCSGGRSQPAARQGPAIRARDALQQRLRASNPPSFLCQFPQYNEGLHIYPVPLLPLDGFF